MKYLGYVKALTIDVVETNIGWSSTHNKQCFKQRVGTLSVEQNSHFADAISNVFYWIEISWSWFKIHWMMLLRSIWQ